MTLDIMMPFYGRADHFTLAVQSVLSQSSPDWRLVIVDDAYPSEEPGAWAARIADPRVTYLRNETNLGVSGNFRRCADLMTSEFGVIMGCDDVMLSRYVERIHELSEQFPDASMIQPGVGVIDSTGRPCRPLADRAKSFYRFRGTGARHYSGERLATSLLRADWAYFPSVAWRVTDVQSIGFRLDLTVVQDLAMLVEIIARGGSLVLDDEVVFTYRRHASSVSSVTGPDGSKYREERRVFREAAARVEQLGWRRAARVARLHLSSRLSALTELPGSLRSPDPLARRTIVSHILGREYPA